MLQPDTSTSRRPVWLLALLAGALLFAACSSDAGSVDASAGADETSEDEGVDGEGEDIADDSENGDDGDDSTTDEGVPTSIDLDRLTTGTWTLRFGGGPDGDVQQVDGYPITITFDGDGSFGGTAACNGYGGAYSVDGSQLELSQMSQTEMGCEPETAMTAESVFLAALVDVDGINLVGDELALSGPATELIFSPSPEAPVESLVGRIWLLESTFSESQAVAAEGEPATLQLNADGSFTGSTGCRTLTGRYTVAGSQFLFNEMTADGDCPASLADQDSHVIEVLGDGFNVEADGDHLSMSSTGDIGLQYRAVTEDELEGLTGTDVVSDAEAVEGIEWIFAGGDGPDGPLLDPRTIDPEAVITLTFVGGGYEGDAVCNRYGGTAEIGDSLLSLSLGPAEGEQQGCGDAFDGPDGPVERYLSALAQMTEGGIEGDGERLVINGNDIELHFERAG